MTISADHRPRWTCPDPRHTYYKMLMLAEIADAEIISTVYRKLAQRYHPDVDPSPEAARRMAEINEAYATLRDRKSGASTTRGWPAGATGAAATD